MNCCEMMRLLSDAFCFFSKSPSIITTIDIDRFDSDIIIIRDNMTIKDDLFSEVEVCMEFIRKHICKKFIITGKAQRDEE